MVENKKVDTPKTGTTTAQPAPGNPIPEAKDRANELTGAKSEPAVTPRVPESSPGDKVNPPTAGEVKKGFEVQPDMVVNKDPNKPSPDKIIEDTVKRTADSVKEYNKSAEIEKKVEPPAAKRPEDFPKAPTREESIEQTVKRTTESVEMFNKSAEVEKNAPLTAEVGEDLRPDVKRVAPLTGELRSDQEDDSYVTPGKTPAPPGPVVPQPAPELAPQPLVIAPITGEVKPADETSYPTPGKIADPDRLEKAVEIKPMHQFGKRGQFNVPEGHQVPLFEANKEMIRNKRANAEDNQQLAKALSEAAMTGLDGLRRTRRVQKNLR
jgi:hypothetical protein